MKITYSNPPAETLKRMAKNFPKYRASVLRMPFANLPWHDLSALEKLRVGQQTFANIAVVGIGGSSLGAKAIASALNNKKLAFLDNIDPESTALKLKKLNLKKTLFLLVSKSGETIEILSLASIIFSKVRDPKNFIAVTDSLTSGLGLFAQKNKIPVFQSPAGVPGRFSVLSLVSLLPAALAGVQITKILKGAQKTSWREAFNLACRQYLHYIKGKNIAVIFPYAECLNDFSNWCIQLLSESIGKSKRVGITPLKAMGAKDQHSQLQLFLDGPDDKFFIFIKPERIGERIKIPGKKFSLQDLFDAEYAGVKKALIKKKKPFCEIAVPIVSEESSGGLFFLFELETAFLGELFKINAFNQPAVESSKKITKFLLRNPNIN